MLLSYTLMNIIISSLSPIVQLFIRNEVIKVSGLTTAGYWQAITKISDYYLTFIISVLGVYYLPTLSGITQQSEIRKEILKGYKIILPVVAILAISIFLCKSLIVNILFSAQFEPMKELFQYQMLGDFLKIGSWLLAYLMLAKAMVKMLIITEILFNLSLVILSKFFIDKYGVVGTTYAFALNYLFYWITMAVLMRKYLFVQKGEI